MTVDINDMVRFGNPSDDPLSMAFKSLGNADTDPDTVALMILKPDGALLAFSWPTPGDDGLLVREGIGRFYADVVIDMSGTWRFRLEGTGAVQAASESSLRVDRRRVG